MLRAWGEAPAFVVSCPGPLRRHHAALTPISQLVLPQILLGAEAQLNAFAAQQRGAAERSFFTPLPEAFFTAASQAPLWALVGERPDGRLPVHMRFGGTRSARIMKEAVNGFVLAEDHAAPPVTASGHPFASGLVLPAAMRRLFLYDEAVARPLPLGRDALPEAVMPEGYVTADLAGGEAAQAPELTSFAHFHSAAFAAGPLRSEVPAGPCVLLPWNLDHPGSIVPLLLQRALRLGAVGARGAGGLRLIVYPFNYPGQTGLIRRLIRGARGAASDPQAAMASLYLARVASPAAIAGLAALAPIVWLDGNDPEHGWSKRRLRAAGFRVVTLATGAAGGEDEIAADETLMLAAETRFGQLHFAARLPSLRGLRQLLALTHALLPQTDLAPADLAPVVGPAVGPVRRGRKRA